MEQLILEELIKLSKQMGEQIGELRAEIKQRFAEQDAKFFEIEKRFAEQDDKIEKRFVEQDAKIKKSLEANILEISEMFRDMIERFDKKADKEDLEKLYRKNASNY